jgi:hypothetical protein
VPADLRRAQGLAGGGAGAGSGQGPGHRAQAGPLGNHGGQDRAKGFGAAGGGGLRLGVLLQGARATAAQLDATSLFRSGPGPLYGEYPHHYDANMWNDIQDYTL